VANTGGLSRPQGLVEVAEGRRRAVQNVDTIKYILRHMECKPEIVIRVPCLYCNVKRALLLIPSTGRYECQICGKHGRLDDLAVLAADRFEYRHRRTVELMETDGVIRRERMRGYGSL